MGAGGDARAAADTRGGIKGGVGVILGDRQGIGIDRAAGAHRDIATGLNDAIEGTAIDHQVAHHGKGFGLPRLNGDGIAVFEGAHVKLTGCRRAFGPVGNAVDDQAAHAANALAAIAVKLDGIFALFDQALVYHIQHLQKGHVG